MNVSNVSDEGGNTRPLRARSRRFVMTLNNYSDLEKQDIIELSQCLKIIGEEIGKSGTPHLQCYFEFNNQKDFSTLQKIAPRAHWAKARGNREQNIQYCSKEKVIYNDFPEKFSEADLINKKKERILQNRYKDVEWKPWQQSIINIINGEANSRDIWWFWEPTGNAGKTFLANYIYMKYNCVCGDGKKADIAYKIIEWQKEHKQADPDVIILDIPRDSLNWINYSMLEKFKDGLFSSPKYESCDVIFEKIPHVICFANEIPNIDKVSADRWHIVGV